MSNKQWEAIMEGAQSFVRKKVVKEVQYNVILHDPMFN
jgi:hypothetical protein